MSYFFGFPDVLVNIHFPRKGLNASESLPWYWWLGPPEQPYYFQYIGSEAGGNGWQRTQNAPMIKILHADTQRLQPTPVLGFSTLENAIDKGAQDAAWGRFQFTEKFFWKVLGKKKPQFQSIQGRPTVVNQPNSRPQKPIARQISDAV